MIIKVWKSSLVYLTWKKGKQKKKWNSEINHKKQPNLRNNEGEPGARLGHTVHCGKRPEARVGARYSPLAPVFSALLWDSWSIQSVVRSVGGERQFSSPLAAFLALPLCENMAPTQTTSTKHLCFIPFYWFQSLSSIPFSLFLSFYIFLSSLFFLILVSQLLTFFKCFFSRLSQTLSSAFFSFMNKISFEIASASTDQFTSVVVSLICFCKKTSLFCHKLCNKLNHWSAHP